jgi:GDP-4-dehydro-6-deoxy-D-mannose reductase
VRILVTGSRGFVGRWVGAELERAGHERIPEAEGGDGRLEITDRAAVAVRIAETRPEAVIHLAAVSSGAEAALDPARAMAVAVGGTRAVIDALAALRARTGERPVLLIAGSAEVYGSPAAGDLPLTEVSPLRPVTPYALAKSAQEEIALREGTTAGLRVIAVRAFNHTGPGQTASFAIPAFASRILAAKANGASSIVVGDIDLRRDLADVRDVADAYRRLVEFVAAADGDDVAPDGLVVNVGSGRAVLLRDVVAELADLAGVTIEPVIDTTLLRSGEAREIRADVSRLSGLTGWTPTIPLRQTLIDILRAQESAPD